MAAGKGLEDPDSAGNINIARLVNASLWSETLAGFREKAAGTDPVPAGVAISAVTASLALALLVKVLSIAGRKRDVSALLDRGRAESARLADLADRDIRAFDQYMATRDSRPAIEVPMEAARAAVRGLALCAEAGEFVKGLTAADIGAAALLLSGAIRAMLLSVDFNLKYMRADEEFSGAIAAERQELEREALRLADAVTVRGLRTLLRKPLRE
jgi:formiminotetrahydrofolate cyclodeaminase